MDSRLYDLALHSILLSKWHVCMTLRLKVLQDLCAALTKVLNVSTSKLFSLFLFTLGSSKSLLLNSLDHAVPDGVGEGGVMTR